MDKYTKAIIQYYNVEFYLHIKNECDSLSIKYFMENINKDIRMTDIFEWCKTHNIFCTTKFRYRKDFPITANLWNFYSYTIAKLGI